MKGHQLLDELKRTVDALQAFSEIGKALTSTLEIKEVLRIVLQKVSDLLEPSSWSLLLLKPDGKSLYYEIIINEASIDRDQEIQLGQGIPGHVALHMESITWPPKCPKGVTPPGKSISLLCVPLKSKGKALGVIELRRDLKSKKAFTEDDLRTVEVIADYAAIAIENARNFERIQELTITDDLTSLYNVRHMHTIIDRELDRAQRYSKEFSMIFLDLDHFKNVNDTWGHIHGSALLAETADLLKNCIRTVDFGARYGGDEFVIMLPETGKKEATMIAERLRARIEENEFLKEKGLAIKFTASFGVATFPDDAQSKEDLIRLADKAMYHVKKTSRNSVA